MTTDPWQRLPDTNPVIWANELTGAVWRYDDGIHPGNPGAAFVQEHAIYLGKIEESDPQSDLVKAERADGTPLADPDGTALGFSTARDAVVALAAEPEAPPRFDFS